MAEIDELHAARKIVHRQKEHIRRLKAHCAKLEKEVHYWHERVRGEGNSWKALSRSGGVLLQQSFFQLRARGNLRRRIIQHLAAIGMEQPHAQT